MTQRDPPQAVRLTGVLRMASIAAMFVAAPGHADPPSWASLTNANHQVLVPVDVNGRPGKPTLSRTVPEEARGLVEAHVLSLRFEPAKRDDQPVASELSLSVRVLGRASYRPSGPMIGTVRATPIVAQLPNYPANAMRRGQSAAVMVKVELAPEPGPDRVRAEIVDSRFNPPKAGAYEAVLLQSAIDMLEACCDMVETIDGQPLSMVAYVPAAFIAPWAPTRIDMGEFNAPWRGKAKTEPEGVKRAKLLPVQAPAPEPAGDTES